MTQNTPVKAAIVGLGRWGQTLVQSSASLSTRSLVFVRGMTRTPEKAVSFGTEYGFDVIGDYSTLLRDPEIEAVVLATPHSQHCQQICTAAKAGKHVLVEKPLALTVNDAEAAISSCRDHGVVLAVGFNRRFLPAFQDLSSKYHKGDLGKALHIEGNFSGPFGYNYTSDMWRGRADENPAGGMAAMGIHMLDAMIHLLGPVRRVSTLSRRLVSSSEVDDTTTAQLEFECGATGSLTSLMATASNWRLQVFGSKGWAAMPDQETLEIHQIDAQPVKSCYDPVDTLSAELDAFSSTIRTQRDFPVTLTEARAAVSAMEMISLSAARGGEAVIR